MREGDLVRITSDDWAGDGYVRGDLGVMTSTPNGPYAGGYVLAISKPPPPDPLGCYYYRSELEPVDPDTLTDKECAELMKWSLTNGV